VLYVFVFEIAIINSRRRGLQFRLAINNATVVAAKKDDTRNYVARTN
jgi:hypothetical protein